MQEIIEMLLEKQATLEADREAEKEIACKEIDARYEDRAEQINSMLKTAGYVKPVEEATEEVEEVEEVEAADEVETPTVPEAPSFF